MSVWVILTAGGVGSRAGSDIPKQFIHIENRPAIAYTMEVFQRHPASRGSSSRAFPGGNRSSRPTRRPTASTSFTAVPCTEVIARRDAGDEAASHETIRRERLARTQTSHVMRLGELLALHKRANEDGVDSAALPELMVRYGMAVHLTAGDEMNFKITTPSDLQIFRALVERER